MDEHAPIVPTEIRLDLRGLKCPLPALKTRAVLTRLSPGAVLVVETTDPMAAIDIPHLVATIGDILVAQSVAGAAQIFQIRKAGG